MIAICCLLFCFITQVPDTIHVVLVCECSALLDIEYCLSSYKQLIIFTIHIIADVTSHSNFLLCHRLGYVPMCRKPVDLRIASRKY